MTCICMRVFRKQNCVISIKCCVSDFNFMCELTDIETRQIFIFCQSFRRQLVITMSEIICFLDNTISVGTDYIHRWSFSMLLVCVTTLSHRYLGTILVMRPANGRWRYSVTSSLIGRAHTKITFDNMGFASVDKITREWIQPTRLLYWS